MSILVFLNGVVVENKDLYQGEVDEIIGVDGGFDKIPQHLKEKKIKIIGDLDSIKKHPGKYEIMEYPVEKDFSDFELALDYISRTYQNKDVKIFGLLGGRIDHQLFNLFVLTKHIENNRFIAVGEHEIIFFSNGEIRIKGYVGKTFSIFPLSKLKGLTIEGAHYSLKNKDIDLYSSLTLSNVIIKNNLHITAKKGEYAVIINKGVEPHENWSHK